MKTRAVFFDFMGTLAQFVPEREDLLVSAAANFGISLSVQAARLGFAIAADWWNHQVSQLSLEARSPDGRAELYKGYDLRVLQAAGAIVSEELAYQVFREVMQQARGSRIALFEDVAHTFETLQTRKIALGVISNMDRTLPQLLAQLGVDGYLSVVVSSGEAGLTKPQPEIFRVALERSGVAPEEALYVGDQYENDVLGARQAGLTPILVDRYDLFPHLTEVTRIRSLEEVARHLA